MTREIKKKKSLYLAAHFFNNFSHIVLDEHRKEKCPGMV